MRLLAVSFGLLLALFPGVLHAQVGSLPGIVNAIISGTPLTTQLPVSSFVCNAGVGIGACELASLFIYLVERSRVVIGTVAFLMLVLAAATLVIRQSEEAITMARRTITGVVLGIFLLFLSEQYVDALYGGFSIAAGEVLSDPQNIEAGVFILSSEILGIVRWAETLVAILVIGIIVVEAASVLASMGNEETIRKAYRAVYSSLLGVLLIVFDRAIAAIFGYTQIAALPGAPDATIFIVEIFGFLRLILGFVAIVAVAILVYAGLLMLFNYGNDEMITKAKTILINAAIGLALLVLSFTIVHTVILGIA